MRKRIQTSLRREPSVNILPGAQFIQPARIRIGAHSQIDTRVILVGGLGLRIGRNVHFAVGSTVTGGGRCVIGDFAGIGVGVHIVTGTDLCDGSGLTNPTVPDEYRAVRRGEVRIGSHALIYTGAVILPGVRVGAGAVVAAGSVVHHDLKPWRIYAGLPLVAVGIRPRSMVLELAAKLVRRKERP